MTRAQGRWLIAACGAALATGGWQLGTGCSRRADIAPDGQGGSSLQQPNLDAGDIPDLDAGLGSDAYPACADRPLGDCQGPVDFPCAFGGWVEITAERCQQETGCVTDGWLEVTMGADGCVSSIGMDRPNDAMVACVLAEVGAFRCPCGVAQVKYFFGLGNNGCGQSCAPEFPCPGGLECVDGHCVAGGGAGQ